MIVIRLAGGSRDILAVLQGLKVRRTWRHLRRGELSPNMRWFGKSFRGGRMKASSRGDNESSSSCRNTCGDHRLNCWCFVYILGTVVNRRLGEAGLQVMSDDRVQLNRCVNSHLGHAIRICCLFWVAINRLLCAVMAWFEFLASFDGIEESVRSTSHGI